ncbi:hypothetical protein DL767_003492 [Monosporascus sp. MG133]|nr:hypothetical protein DL767_003492 [Monosporascus sp. MG133]
MWCKSILEADDLGFLKEPHEIEDAVGCEKTFGDGVYAGGLTQRGSGLDDGTYRHYSDEKVIIYTLESGWDRNRWVFAWLFSNERDDFLGWSKSPTGTLLIYIDGFGGNGHVFYNRGRGDVSGSRYEWQPVDRVYHGSQAGSCMYCPDLDGDGRADMHGIKHSIDSTAETWFNRCTGDGPDEAKTAGDEDHYISRRILQRRGRRTLETWSVLPRLSFKPRAHME